VSPVLLNPPEASSPVGQYFLSVKAPAKINWFLRILRRRDDGYHDIVSLMQCISLYDELTLHHADSVIVEGNMDIPMSENLIYRAASLLKEHSGYPGGARISVKKQIPLSAGLGGGSSDAAYTLSGLNALWQLGLGNEELCSIGSRVGSDVPFFFHAPVAVIEGRGDRITPMHVEWRFTLLLVKAAVDISTRWAYEAHDMLSKRRLTNEPIDIKLFCQALEGQDFPLLSRMLFNDFEDIVLREYPVVGEIKRVLREMGAEVSLMSGSGPTIFGLFRNRETAEKAREAVKPEWSSIVQTLAQRGAV